MLKLRWFFFLASLAVGAVGPAAAQEKVRIGLAQAVNVTHSMFGFGDELGFFAEEGLSIEFVALQGSGVLVPQIAAKAVTVGLTNPDLAIIGLAKGEPYPITFVYNYLRKSVYELAVKESSSIKSVADLKGKRLGIGALSWGNIPMIRAILRDAGLEWGRDVQAMPIGMGPAAWKQFSDDKVDVMAYFTSENARIVASGIPIRKLEISSKYEVMFSAGAAFHNDTIANNPKLVEGFGRATAKSTVACLAAPQACLRAYWRLDPTAKPPAGQEAAWIAQNLPLMMSHDSSIAYFPNGQAKEWGQFSSEAWAQHIALMYAGGQISVGTLPIDRIYTNRFVPAFNKFDVKAITDLARAKEASIR